ncbi:MAG: glycosyltransferase [Cellulomonadaceae bacterium]|jgi:glycosyltransferase involved in cell wall biosynthesis|nr:glycosyltransferase [Cellulomonadaceae bacterium]
MRIGLFTDSYHPASNGVVVVIDTTRRELERAGHEVWVFAPDGGVLPSNRLPDDDHVVRFPAIQYDLQIALMFPRQVVKYCREYQLDIIHFFTPATLGLSATLAAYRTGAVLVGQHSTDTYEFSKDYPAIVGAYIAEGLLIPLMTKLSSTQKKQMFKLYTSPRRKDPQERWAQRFIAGMTALLYSNTDGLVAVSHKSAQQLLGFAERNKQQINVRVIPSGVDVMPPAESAAVEAFKAQWDIAPEDEVIINFGRMAEEKNQVLLVQMLPILLTTRPHAKVVLAGDYVFREELEAIADASPVRDRIVFTGRYARSELPVMCAAADLFAFPSLTDTQALVLNEAAGQSLPIVMCDENVNDVFVNGVNGVMAKPEPADFAAKVSGLLADPARLAEMAEQSRRLALEFSEEAQTTRLVEFYEELERAKYPLRFI